MGFASTLLSILGGRAVHNVFREEAGNRHDSVKLIGMADLQPHPPCRYHPLTWMSLRPWTWSRWTWSVWSTLFALSSVMYFLSYIPAFYFAHKAGWFADPKFQRDFQTVYCLVEWCDYNIFTVRSLLNWEWFWMIDTFGDPLPR